MDLSSTLLGAVVVAVVWALKEFFVPDLLDRNKQKRTSELQREAEQRAYEREDAPVRARIISAALDLLRSFRRVFVREDFSLVEWQALHDKLIQMVECDSGARALGEQLYLQTMEVLNYDQLSINVQASIARGETPPSHYLRAQHDAQFAQNIAITFLQFIPILDALGADFAREEFGKNAAAALAAAEQVLSRLPTSYDS